MPRPEADILLCSYRVSGRTWVRFMLSDCMARACDSDQEVDLTTCFSWLPNWAWADRVGFGGFEPERLCGLPVIAAAHDVFKPMMSKHKIVWLYRDPMDILSSRYARRPDELRSADLGRYLDESGDIDSYSQWLNSWAAGLGQCKDVCVLGYEDLSEDRGREMRRLCDFCDISLSEEDFAQVVERGSLESMRAIQSVSGVGGSNEQRVRTGGVRKFEQNLSLDDRQLLAGKVIASLEKAGVELLERMGSGAIEYARS